VAPGATDNCGPATVTSDAPARFRCGKSVVTWTATDGAGLTSNVTQEVWRRCEDEEERGHDHDDRDDHHGARGQPPPDPSPCLHPERERDEDKDEGKDD
jgi:hypothetical protein